MKTFALKTLCLLFVSFLVVSTVQAQRPKFKDMTSKEIKDFYKYFEDEKDTVEMVKILKQGFKYHPEDVYFTYGLLSIYLETKQFNDARYLMNKAVKKVPSEPMYWYHYGRINEASGDYVSAEAHYLQALALEREHVGATAGMGILYYRRGLDIIKEAEQKQAPQEVGLKAAKPQFSIALNYLETAFTLQNDNASVLKALIDIYGKLGQEKKRNFMLEQLDKYSDL